MADKKDKPEMAVNINLDTTPIFYTDNVFMTANEDGIVFNVGQKVGPSNQVRVVARFGMSRNHAKKFLKEINNLLALTEGSKHTGKEKN